jgi:hypothetical protein
MGIPLLRQAAISSNGNLVITSQIGKGTQLSVTFQCNHLNRAPLGDIAETLVNLVIGTPDVHFVYGHRTDSGYFTFDSYWFYGRMAELDCSQYALVTPARALIYDHLKKIQSNG